MLSIASSIRQLKRRQWKEIAYQSADFGGMHAWYWHLAAEEQDRLKAAVNKGLILMAQKRVGESDYRLLAQTTLEWERGSR